jgi:CheY-like chemotaxis protein
LVTDIRHLVQVVGREGVAHELRLRLGMYRTVSVGHSLDPGELEKELKISTPDCVVAVLTDKKTGQQLLQALRPLQKVGVVMLVPKVTDHLRRITKELQCLCSFGKRGLATRGAELVAQHLCLSPRSPPKIDVEQPPMLELNGSSVEVKITDLAPHAAILFVKDGKATLAGMDATLRLAPTGGATIDASGRLEVVDEEEDGAYMLLRFSRADAGVTAQLERVTWLWSETVQARQRQAGADGRIRSSARITPRTRFIARVNPDGTKRQFYFRLENLSAESALFSSTGKFESSLEPGMEVNLQVSCARGRLDLAGHVVRVSQPGSDTLRPSYQAFAVEFDRSRPGAPAELERLQRYVGAVDATEKHMSEEPTGPRLTADLVTSAQFAQRHLIRVRDVKRALKSTKIGQVVQGVLMFRENEMYDVLRKRIEELRKLRERRLYFHVLAVDDDVENVETIRRTLRKKYKVFGASSGAEGLEILRREIIEVVIADQRMPGMSGTEMLQKSLEINPNVIRIILSAYTDAQALTEAINIAKAHHFLYKPITREELCSKVEAAFKALGVTKHVHAIELGEHGE